jgi:CRP/FNR family cyclic AMP-dependent transcriptional regulator
MPEAIWFLKRCPLFEHLSPDECRRLEARTRARTFPKKAVIYFPDQPGESVLLLARGRVKILSLTPGGRETIVAFVEPGELFGELAVLDASPRSEYAEAVEESLTLAIPRDELVALMARRPDVALAITKLIGLRRRRVETRLKNLLFRTTRERTAAVLVELTESHGRAVGPYWEIAIRLSHQDLANLVGATRETVTLTLGQMQKEGLIRVSRRRITVLNRAGLAAEVAGDPMPGVPSRPERVPR